MKSVSHRFTNGEGYQLAGKLDLPGVGDPMAYVLFAHCFTCGKDLKAVTHISQSLTDAGFGVFRFDFPGLGASEGAFGESTFTSNVDDLYRASLFLRELTGHGPQLLVGHSLGGAAVLRAAEVIESVKGVVTIGAPADPAHATHLLAQGMDEIREKGKATVSIARREFLIHKEMVEDLESVSMEEATARLGKALLIFHSPIDQIVGIENAGMIYDRARHPKSFVSLDQADHLLSRPQDSRYVGTTIAAWASRYLEIHDGSRDPDETRIRLDGRGFRCDVLAGGHRMVADEPIDIGGTDEGPAPYDFLTAGLGACTAMTLRMYADHKKWPLESVEVRLRHRKVEGKELGLPVEKGDKVDLIERELQLEGDLTEEQRSRITEIADRCPVHRTLKAKVEIQTRLTDFK